MGAYTNVRIFHLVRRLEFWQVLDLLMVGASLALLFSVVYLLRVQVCVCACVCVCVCVCARARVVD